MLESEQQHEPQVCYSCDEEFAVHSPYETTAIVSFCPFCGSEVESEIDENMIIDDLDDDDDDLDDEPELR